MVGHQLEGLLVEAYRAAFQVDLSKIRRLILLLCIRKTIFLVCLMNEYLPCKIDGGGIAAPGFCPDPNGLAGILPALNAAANKKQINQYFSNF